MSVSSYFPFLCTSYFQKFWTRLSLKIMPQPRVVEFRKPFSDQQSGRSKSLLRLTYPPLQRLCSSERKEPHDGTHHAALQITPISLRYSERGKCWLIDYRCDRQSIISLERSDGFPG